jgi:hypothetical protein
LIDEGDGESNNVSYRTVGSSNLVYDVNGNGVVDVSQPSPTDDGDLVTEAYNSQPPDLRWNPDADVDQNGQVKVQDTLAVVSHYGQVAIAPDLRITNIYGDTRAWPPSGDNSITHKVVVKNEGTAASVPTTLRVCLSTDSTLNGCYEEVADPPLAVPALQPGEETQLTYSDTVTWTKESGRQRYYVNQIDPGNVNFEEEEADNVSSRSVGVSGLPYDYDGSGAVNVSDILGVVGLYSTVSTAREWNPDADMAPSGSIDVSDILAVTDHYSDKAYQAEVHVTSVTPSGGAAPLTVTFNYYAHFYEGDITEFKFDYTGDGVWDETVPNSDTSDVVSGSRNHTYIDPGVYTARVGATGPAGSTDYASAPQVTVLTRSNTFAAAPFSSTQASLSWTSIANAATYEFCYNSLQPNLPAGDANWNCTNVGSVTSWTWTLPTPTLKATYYLAIRGVTSGGGKGKLSDRAAVAFINETVSGTTYHSYFTVYKNSGGTKYINGFNQNTSSRWMAFSNTTPAQDIKSQTAVTANTRWYTTPSAWTAPDWITWYGPLVEAIESPNSSLSPNDLWYLSLYCMGPELWTSACD